jgi:hypothetical protein
MTKPLFVLRRIQELFRSDDVLEQLLVYDAYIKKRNEEKNKHCFCGHMEMCDCENPSFICFKDNVLNSNINEKNLL